MSDDKLQPLREQIDAIDAQLLALLNQRARVAQEVGHVKAETNAPVFRPEREAQVLARVAANNAGPLPSSDLQTIFREVMSACRALERRITVAFLGPVGTYSEQAVWQQFGQSVTGLPCISIDEVFRATEAGTADFGVVPIENSTEGTINRTLDLLLQTSLSISGELSLPVHHSLLTTSGYTAKEYSEYTTDSPVRTNERAASSSMSLDPLPNVIQSGFTPNFLLIVAFKSKPFESG